MKKYSLLFVACAALFLIVACQKDIDIFTPYDNNDISKIQEYPTSGIASSHDIGGEIVDENNEPIEGVKINIGKDIAFTDKYGIFIVDNVSVKSEHVYIRAEKTGYFNGSRVIVANKKTQNYAKIILIKKQQITKFDAKIGAETKIGKASISFPKNGYKNAQGVPFLGEVVVHAKYLDPSNPSTFLEMPGDLRGLSSKIETVCLGTYGMIVCELSDNTGNPIQLNGDSTATIRYPITSKFQDTPPSSVPLWYFNERIGTWIEEGSSTLQGDTYIGKVKHFSFWNCDYPYSLVYFKASFIDDKGSPISGLKVALCFKTGKDSLGISQGHGQTAEDGTVCGYVPKNQALTMKLFDKNTCYVPFYTQSIGPFNNNTTLAPTTVFFPNLPVEHLTLNGKMRDCNGNFITKSYVRYNIKLQNGNSFEKGIILADSAGNFSKTIFRSSCQGNIPFGNITFVGVDTDFLKESDEKTIPIQKGANNLGEINICNNITEYFAINHNGVKTIINPVLAKFSPKTEDIECGIVAWGDTSTSQQNQFQLNILNSTSNYKTNKIYSSQLIPYIRINGTPVYISKKEYLPLVFTKVADQKGEFYEGYFNKESITVIIDDDGRFSNIKGSFRFKRDW